MNPTYRVRLACAAAQLLDSGAGSDRIRPPDIRIRNNHWSRQFRTCQHVPPQVALSTWDKKQSWITCGISDKVKTSPLKKRRPCSLEEVKSECIVLCHVQVATALLTSISAALPPRQGTEHIPGGLMFLYRAFPSDLISICSICASKLFSSGTNPSHVD